MSLSENAKYILKQRYLKKDENRETIESPKQLFRRVARAIAEVDFKYGKTKEEIKKEENDFLNMMIKFEFLPNSPTLMNAGTDLGQLSACFVLPVDDDIDAIFEAIHYTAKIHKTGGGTGMSFSRLRPKDDIVKSTGGIASGPISFMTVFDSATEVIKQGGKRRGANMGILRVDHPDIFDFIVLKEKEGALRNFNISIGLTKGFMKAVELDKDFDLINPKTKKVSKTIKARALWNLIITMSWKNGEPGIIFLDKINDANPTPELGEIESTNPCISGDTLIETPYGPIAIKQLAKEKEFLVYGFKNGRIVLTKATNIRKTRKHVPTIKLITTRGTLVSTPDHLARKTDGTYEKTFALKNHEKLTGFCRRKKGEKWLQIGCMGKYRSEHRIVAEYFGNINGKDVHHINGNTFDNRPSNLKILNHSNHSVLTNIGHLDWNQNSRNQAGRFVSKPTKLQKKYLSKCFGNIGMNWYVIGIKKGPTIDVYDMKTGTSNFFANGICVHNCGEQPLLPYESCNLGSINLSKFIKNGKVDWDKLRKITRLSVRFLDNVVDANKYPLPQIANMTLGNRKIGLGVMGWADMLLMVGIKYDTDEAIDLGRNIIQFIHNEGFQMSQELGKEKGNFPNMPKSIYKDLSYLRNATITTIAPTGTISIIADCSSGIEPIFAIIQRRNVKETLGEDLIEVNPAIRHSLELKGLWSPQMEEALKKTQCVKCTLLPKETKDVVVTSAEIAPEWHIKMQSAFQDFTDNAVSKTINLSGDATPTDIETIYLLAYKLKCKGITVYRDGSRKHQLLTKEEGRCPVCGDN
jgi:ribonucleoside-diphosphate reductase alpha chain